MVYWQFSMALVSVFIWVHISMVFIMTPQSQYYDYNLIDEKLRLRFT